MKKTSLAILSIVILSISLVAQDIENDLLLFYPFNGNTEDSSPNGYDGQPFGITYIEDRFGNPNGAASFDGTNDYVNFPNLEELKPDLPVSFSFWIRYDSPSFQDRAVFNTSFEENINTGVYLTSRSSQGTYAMGYGDGSPFYSSSSIRAYASNTVIETGEWIHLAIVVSGPTDFQIYVNCVENGGEFNGSGGELVYSDLPGCIGRHDQNTGSVQAYYFDGAIDDFRYWSRELTEEEIEQLCFDTEYDCPNLLANVGDECETNGELGVIAEDCLCVIDECQDFPYYLADVNDDGSTDIYGIDIEEGAGELDLIHSFENERHIALNNSDGLIYSVQKADGTIQTLNPSNGALGEPLTPNSLLEEVIGAAFNSNGDLLMLSQSQNSIFQMDVETGSVEVYDSYSPVLGGDIAVFNEDIYLATREGFGSLYLAFPDNESDDELIGDVPQFVTGLAISEAESLIMSSKGSGQLLEYSVGGIELGSIPLSFQGDEFVLNDGDLAAGCLNVESVQTSMPESYSELTPYPNPASSKFNLDFKVEQTDQYNISLRSVTGFQNYELLDKQFTKGEQKLELDIRSIPEGIYIVELRSSKSIIQSKLIIRR